MIAVMNGRQFQLNLASMNTWGGIDAVRNKRAFDAANPTRTHVSLRHYTNTRSYFASAKRVFPP